MAILIKVLFSILEFLGSSLVVFGSSLVFSPRGIGKVQGEGILRKVLFCVINDVGINIIATCAKTQMAIDEYKCIKIF